MLTVRAGLTFGPKSEKITQEIEQLELKLKELEAVQAQQATVPRPGHSRRRRLLDEQNTQTGGEWPERMALERMRDALSLSPERINVCVCSSSEASDSLSQWRAYGGSSGFAIGFSHQVLRVTVEKQNFFLAKCIYDPADQLDIVRALVEEVLDQHLSKTSDVADVEHWLDKEDEETFWKTGGRLLDYLYRYAPMLKDWTFREEQEWRIISIPVLAPHLHFIEGRSLIIPYYPLPIWEDGQREIHEIIVGPTRDVERSMRSVRKMIMGHYVIKDGNLKGVLTNKTPIRPSEVPYRDW